MVFQIAKAELRNLFYSPVAWFLAIAFLVQCAWYYSVGIVPMARMQEIALEMQPGYKGMEGMPITYLFFISMNSPFTIALQNLFLFVPLLTMGLMSREVNSGTIKLLYSSPVKLRQIVTGKFLAIMLYNIMLVLILGIFLVAAVSHIKSADYGLLLSAMLGFYLLTCAYTAIGVFMSSLTSYQIISAIGTFAVVLILSRIGGLWQKIDFVRDITYSLYLSGRTEKMLKGLIDSKDVIYFVMIVFMFMGFTLVTLRNLREKKPWHVKTMRVIMVMVITLSVTYIFSRPQFTFYWDTTVGDKNTIHENTRHIVKEMEGDPLEVTLYVNLLGRESTYGFPEARNVFITSLWEQYQRFKTDISFKYVYYYYYDNTIDDGELAQVLPGKTNKEMAVAMAQGFGVKLNSFMPPEEIKKQIDLDPEGYRLVMKLKYKDRTEFLRTYQVPRPFPDDIEHVWPSEGNVAAALKRLVHPELIPKIVFTQGNLERDITKVGEREYRFSIIMKQKSDGPANLGFDFDTVCLDKQDIPQGITALVMADPKTALSATTQHKLKEYIDQGGNLILMGEPGKQQVLNPVLKYLGVEMLDGSLVEPTYDEMPQMVNPYYTPTTINLSDENGLKAAKFALNNKFSKDTSTMLMPGVAALSHSDSNGFVIEPLMLTKETKTWIKKGKLVVDSAAVIYSPKEGDIKGSFPTGLQLNRTVGKKQQHIAIFGDADFISNKRVLNGEVLNKSVYYWMTENQFPVYTPRPDPKDILMSVSGSTAKMFSLFTLWGLPSLLLIAAIVLLVRRKRK